MKNAKIFQNTARLTPKVASITVGNTAFEYRIDEGEGLPCIVVGTAQMYPGTLSDDLKKIFKFIHVDYRGSIQNNEPIDIQSITLDTLLADIELVREELNLGKIAVFGHSIHGLVALEYGRKYPENTSHIIVIGSPAARDANADTLQAAYWMSMASDERKQLLTGRRKMMQDSINQAPSGKRLALSYITDAPWYWYDPNYDCTWIWQEVKPLNIDFIEHLFGSIFKDYTLDWKAKPIQHPVFVALGKYDFASPPTVWDTTQKKTLTHLTIEHFEQSGHWPFLEEQALFDKKLITWMNTIE